MNDLKSFIIFLTIFLGVYFSMNSYVLLKGNLALQLKGVPFWVYIALFVTVSLAFPVSFFIRRLVENDISPLLTWIGSLWLGAIIYFFLIGLAVDFIRFFNYIFSYIPEVFYRNQLVIGRTLFVIVVLAVSALILAGYLHSKDVKVRRLDLAVDTLPVDSNPLKVVFVSDIHLGRMIGKDRLKGIVELVNGEGPDIILIGGDLFDEEADGLYHVREILSSFKAKYGAFAVLGNHEFYHGPDESTHFMESANIRVLRDKAVTVPGIVNIVGLDDYSDGWGRRARDEETLKEIIDSCDENLPTILMTHTPVYLDRFAALGVDLALFGHTHNGQFFPFNLVTDSIFKLSYGYGRVGDMHAYVSSGAGTWGPPIRVLTDVEIVKINLVTGKN
ncbi:MAG: metallophosphoesterase [Deltaproteobacteria bacterium]|uniref:Metallophosphoesterase n=1 Tax=Candidatus Zymogenus saltonus TaxID=2844893 RepID=A0A9D8PJ74_9DELT|nr:metallophosphoesterase [Candidatus Zymogenus saltonus]